MDKYEYSIKADKIRKLVDRKDYATAVKIADTIDWERVKNAKMLSTVSLAYEKLERYEDAKEVLLLAYESAPVGRRFLYRLTELAVKEGKLDEAETYLKEFAATSPKDPSRLILRYEIAEARQEPLERLITILEAYQKREFEERWSYELASLYYRAGKAEECVKLCDEIVLWFGVGPYVDKALELKQEIQPLTPEQLERKEHKEKYLRQLEDIQKEFEEQEQSLGQEKKTVPESPAETEPEPEEAKAGKKEAAVKDREHKVRKPRKTAVEKAADRPAAEDPQNTVLQQEMEASLAKEIETAAMTATLNEMMLRETAATMEEVGAVNNDHSDVRERTKVAAERYTQQTREFAREAFVINEVLKEVTGQPIAADLIEEKLRNLAIQEAMQETWGDAPAEKRSDVTEQQEEMPAAEREPEQAVAAEAAEPETTAVGETAEQETAAVEETVEPETAAEEEKPEQTAVEEEKLKETPAVETELPQLEAGTVVAAEQTQPEADSVVAAEQTQPEADSVTDIQLTQAAGTENPAQEVPVVEREPEQQETFTVEESPAEKVPEKEASEEVQDRPEAAEALGPETQMVRDHYVLVEATEETDGLQRSVTYIRDARLRMGQPATQIAKITGQKLATKEITKTMRKLRGRDLVISGIADLPDDILVETIQWMAEDQIESFIVLLDTREELERLMDRKPYFAACAYLPEEAEPAADVRMEESEQKAETEPEAKAEQKAETEPEVKAEQKAETEPEVKAERKAKSEPEAKAEQKTETQPEAKAEQMAATEPETSEQEAPEEKQTLAQLVEAALQSGGLEAYTAPAKKPGKTAAEPSPRNEGMQPKQFVETAIQYARMLDTIIDEMGELALFALAEDYVQEREPLTEELAQEVVEKAILRAEKRSLKNLLSNRYDKDGYLILKEKHFKED